MARNVRLPMCPKWLRLSLFRLMIETILTIGKIEIYRCKIKNRVPLLGTLYRLQKVCFTSSNTCPTSRRTRDSIPSSSGV